MVALPFERSGLGQVRLRTRGRVCADATERTFMVDDGDPNTGDTYTVKPYHCIYSFWDVGWSPAELTVVATPQPAGEALRRQNDPHPRVAGAVDEILSTVMPIEEDRERPAMEEWLVLACLMSAMFAALLFGLAGGLSDSAPTAIASGCFAFCLVFGLLGTRLFGIENGMAFAVCVMPTIVGGVFLKVRFF